MRFTVLGSGTAIPDAAHGPAGFLVEHDGVRVLVDGGSGTLGRLAAIGVQPTDLWGGVYSHRHPDHCADLVPLLFALRLSRPPRTTDYPLFAGEGFAAHLGELRRVYGRWIEFAGATPVTELPLDGEGCATLAGITLRTRPAAHSAGALHLSFEAGGARVVFSGDTGPSEALVEMARGADLLVCECAAPDDSPLEGHLTPAAVRDTVARARPDEVWLTHLYPGLDPETAVATVATGGVPVRRARDLDLWERR